MKPGTIKWKKFMRALRAISKIVLVISFLLFLLDVSAYPLVFGGVLFAVYLIFEAFSPITEEPNWELVYPELALGLDEVENQNKKS